eukprot:NODE_11994_length_1253_cov_1.762877.p1 GENE.NODE_11994_length_1253_cov_1.762877~~NODE_11994_length_1253_cov_1.762877.p1  ORF type:complete len:357 (-),score=104.20 NODE_11994_length_1253_cov_1.762877:181-1251(-)
MGGADDANPMNRSLPAEVVSRRRRVEREEKEETPLVTDRSQVLAMKPEQRAKWLSKVLQRGQEGKAPLNTVYDIVAHQKFASDLADGVGRRMYRILMQNLAIFSQRQQRFLEGECRLAQLFKAPGGAASSSSVTETTEEMMARCRNFMRQKLNERKRGEGGSSDDGDSGGGALGEGGSASASGHNGPGKRPTGDPMNGYSDMSALWDWLQALPPMQRAESVGALDPLTKERLETFLMMRIRARSDGAAPPAASSSGGAAAARRRGAGAGGVSRSRSGARSDETLSTSSSSSIRRAGSRGRSRRSGNRHARSRSRSGAALRQSPEPTATSWPRIGEAAAAAAAAAATSRSTLGPVGR